MGSRKYIDQDHRYVTTYGGQKTGIMDRIMEIQPPEGIELGLKENTPFVFKLYQSDGTELVGAGTKVQVSWIDNAMDVRDSIYTFQYMPFSKYSYEVQTGEDHKDRLRIDMSDFLSQFEPPPKDTWVIGEEEKLLIHLEADNQVSFSPSGETTHIEIPMIENP